jgi:sugar lactone lactonase YvrE
MGGFLGVTMSAVSPDGRTLVYCSETGPRLMRYDLVEDRQLPDLQSFTPPYPPGPPPMFFGMAFASDGTLYVLRGASLHVVDEAGQTTRQIPLEGFGWATLQLCADGRHAFTSSFFSGEVAKIDLSTGAKVGSIATGAPKAVAGLAEFAG